MTDINSLSASGVYRQTFDRSRVVTNASNITPIVFGFSKKGLFNTAVYCPDSEFFISNFGAIDYSLERKGSFFHRTALELLEQGPVFVVNLYDLSSEAPTTSEVPGTPEYIAQLEDLNLDLTDFKGVSLGSTIFNKPNEIKPVVNFYNRERFWFADSDALNATNNSSSNLLSFVNLSQRSVSVITRKSTINGFDIKAKDWYGIGNVPEFMKDNDYLSDFFIDVFIFEGDFTDYPTLAIDPVFGKFFDGENGFRKDMLAEFQLLSQVNLLGSYSGTVIPDFVDKNGTNQYIQTLVNQDTTLTGVLCAINEEAFDDEFLSGTKIDLVGHNIEKSTNDGLTRIEFLSYKDTIVSEINYTQQEIDVTSSGTFDNVDYEISIFDVLAEADLASTFDGRFYVPELSKIVNTAESTVTAETFNPILGQDTITLANAYADISELRVDSAPQTEGVNYTYNSITGVITRVGGGWAGTETVEVDYTYKTVTNTLEPKEGYVITNRNLVNGSSVDSRIKFTGGAFVDTEETITTIEGRILNSAGAVGKANGIYINDGSGEIVSIEAGAIVAVLAQPQLGYTVINKDSDAVNPTQEYVIYDGAAWDSATGSELFLNGDNTFVVGPNSVLYSSLTAVYTVNELADHTYIKTDDGNYTKILQAGESYNFLELKIEDSTYKIDSNYEVVIDPVYFDFESNEDAYVVTAGSSISTPELWTDISNGTIVTGDTISYNDGSSIATAFVKVSEYQDNLNFNYPASSTDSDKINGFKVEFFTDSSLNVASKLTGASFPNFGETYAAGVAVGANELAIQTLKGALNTSFEVTEVAGVSNEFILSQEDSGSITIGQNIVSTPGDSSNSSRLTRVNKITNLADGSQRVRTDDPVFISKQSSTDTVGIIERYKNIDEFVEYFDITHLYGFRVKPRLLPTPGDASVSVYDVLTKTNLFNTLKDRSIISYRYIVDTFNKGITAESKSVLTSLAYEYKDAIAICNAPSAKEFSESADPVFTDAPTATNPNPELNVRYITTGGNQNLNPQETYSLPSETTGGAYGAFYFPNLLVNERNKTFTVPPAMYVAKNFINKHRVGNPWDIVAGKRRGIISGRNVVGIEYVLNTADREFLEPFGINAITNEPGIGLKINSNQTAKQQTVTALSFINVTEAIIEIQKGIQAILENYLWEFNTSQNRLEIKTLADNFMEQVKLRTGIYAYENVMNSSNNTNAIIDQQKGVIDSYVEPVKGLGILLHRTTILNTGQIESGDFVRIS